MIRAISAWVLLFPALMVALVTYGVRTVCRGERYKQVVATEIAKWRWANRYNNAIEKLTGYKF